jgi:hypothetical protein
MFFLKKSKKRCIVVLSGGIGNQMYQYAFARVFCLENDCELIVDKISGFFRDKVYKRKYELNKFQTKKKYVNLYYIIILLFHRCFYNQSAPSLKLCTKFLGYQFVVESNTEKYINDLNTISLSSINWLIGYWQSENYFNKFSDIIYDEFKPVEPFEGIFINLKTIFLNNDFETVALGIRLYEESIDPVSHVSNRKLKTIIDIQRVIDEIIFVKKKVQFLVFSTRNSDFISELSLPDNSLFITGENGFSDTLSTLWAISKCQHHIITSSTFYWWGAWLSQKNWDNSSQIIYAADNFFNADSHPPNWKKF